jgi:DNA-binding GntR family transcriptional regulator
MAEEGMAETITDFIRRDLRTRFQTQRDLPLDLTLTALSQRYRVSLTPVRLAVRDLVADGLLLKQPNGRLAINREANRRGRSNGSVETLVSPPDRRELENTFTGQVIRMSLRGDTAYLREEATAEQLGVGRAVLRQLLSRLQGKGLIEHIPRCGWRVRRFDEDDMRAYLEIRLTLELKALELAKPHLIRADLEAMLRGNLPAVKGADSRLDNNLHHYLIEKSGNLYLQDFFERHGIYFTMLFDYAAPEAQATAVMARQHRKILRALMARDWPRARKHLAHHIRSQQPVLRRLLRLIGDRDGPTKKKNAGERGE